VSGATETAEASAVRSAAADVVAELYRTEATSLVRLARIFTDDRNAAEDLVQEAFIRFQRTVDRIKDPDKAAPYMRSIVLNLARDHNRRGLMSLRHQETREPPPQAAVEEQALASEDRREVLSAVLALPARQRDCVVLRFYLDLSEREIAETMGISPNSVKTHCRRALAALEKRLGMVP
jgi:RNA polymerase sigma-70 factor (sigma-E family)